jgi:hypothetical protein
MPLNVELLARQPLRLLAAAVVLCSLAAPLDASLTFLESSPYLIVGMGPHNALNGQPGVGEAEYTNNFELGANKAPTPAYSNFLNSGGGPSLLGNVLDIPLSAMVVASGVDYSGNIAITNSTGTFNLQDVGLYATLGVRTAASAAAANAGVNNSFWNDPNMFPNTFTFQGFTNALTNNTKGVGVDVNPGAADQSTRIDTTNYGVFGNTNFAPLLSELVGPLGATTSIPALPSTATLDLTGSQGKIEPGASISGSASLGFTTGTKNNGSEDVADGIATITVGAGLNVIDVVTLVGGNKDFELQNRNLVINGPAGAQVIFRVPDNANFLVTQGNILVGNGGIGLNSVLFYSDKPDNNQHFKFNNTVLNGIAFWTLAQDGGEINVQNGQGCVQFIADKVYLDDVRFERCAFGPPPPDDGGGADVVPEPSAVLIWSLLAACVGAIRRVTRE